MFADEGWAWYGISTAQTHYRRPSRPADLRRPVMLWGGRDQERTEQLECVVPMPPTQTGVSLAPLAIPKHSDDPVCNKQRRHDIGWRMRHREPEHARKRVERWTPVHA